MKIIKKKIALDDYTGRDSSNWGKMTATTFNINVFFTQDIDDMGISTELPFIEQNVATPVNYTSPEWTFLFNKLNLNGYTFNFMPPTNGTSNFPMIGTYPSTRYPGKILNQYFTAPTPVTGLTEDKLGIVTSYDVNNKYKIDFDITSNINAIDYQGNPFTSGTRVRINTNLAPITYLIEGDTSATALAALPNAKLGIYYSSTSAETRTVNSAIFGKYKIPYTEMYYNSEGFNETNIHLSAETKEDYLFGITSSPTVFNDLFIDRGRATVIQSHMQLSEIRNMAELINYGNGFYNLRRY